MGHLPPNHDVERVMASLQTQNAPQRMSEHESCCTGYSAPRWWKFSRLWRGLSMSILSVPPEGTFHSCLSYFLQSRSKEMSFWVEVHSHVYIIPHETWLDWVDMFSFQYDLLFPERISANLLPYHFDSGFSPHTFQASWPSPVFNPPELFILFNCTIDKHSQNF
jgi:hypothetical protein